MKSAIWSIAEIVKIIEARRTNEFDSNIACSGKRGDGKSTLINKALYRLPKFDPWTHQVYSREEVISLLKTQKQGICWDDEAINSGYKRDFQNKGQQELIKILTAYRDNFNTFASAIPSFFSLDKDLRDLYFLHLHVIQRGIAVVHMPLQGRLYAPDSWDAKHNAKIEESWSKKALKNPSFKPQYHKLTTFRGYLYFSPLTDKQQELYKEIKRTKRAKAFGEVENQENKNKEVSFIDSVLKLLIEKKLTKEGLLQACWVNNQKYSLIVQRLNVMLKDSGYNITVSELLKKPESDTFHNKVSDEINSLVPDF